MGLRTYIISMITITMSVWFTPELSEVLKVYVISVVVLITVIVNVLFRITALRVMIVRHLVAVVIQEVLKHPDIQKIIDWKERRDRIYRRIKQEMNRRESQP